MSKEPREFGFEFSGPSRLQGRQKLFPELIWTPSVPARAIERGCPRWKGMGHLELPVPDFVREVKRTNQFSVRVVCILGELVEGAKEFYRFQTFPGITMTLRQEDSDLVFWFRNPLSVRRSLLAYYVRSNSMLSNAMVFYFPSVAQAFRCSSKAGQNLVPTNQVRASGQHSYSFGSYQAELNGCHSTYDARVFLTEGILMGLATRRGRLWLA
jgi:hypothetical protein